jgi:hypothetical protein
MVVFLSFDDIINSYSKNCYKVSLCKLQTSSSTVLLSSCFKTTFMHAKNENEYGYIDILNGWIS